MRRHLSATLLLVMICLLVLSACGSARRTPKSTAPVLVTAAPSKTITPTVPTSTLAATATANLPTSLPSVTSTPTPLPASTPISGPEAYLLKPWDEHDIYRKYEEIKSMTLQEDYSEIKGFYLLSILYEVIAKNPDRINDPKFVNELARVKSLSTEVTWYSHYGALHDLSVEPFIQVLEGAFNTGEVNFASLAEWLENRGQYLVNSGVNSTKVFPNGDRARVVRIEDYQSFVTGIFIIRTDKTKHTSVYSIYPDWQGTWWSDETFQFTDLNGNGQEEISLTTYSWGSGTNHSCYLELEIYEWNETAFRDLMIDPLRIGQNTDYGNCIDITFAPDGPQKLLIQTGKSLATLCVQVPYQEIFSYRWNGNEFKKDPVTQIPEPPADNTPDVCAIDWAVKAGPDNNRAFQILSDALVHWPEGADAEWGPAGKDYLRLKLSVWNIKRGNIEQGLAHLKQVRDHPNAPEYPLPALVAKTFLDSYKEASMYIAVKRVSALYDAEQAPFCKDYECDIKSMVKTWGFREREWEKYWGYGFTNDFFSIGDLTFSLKQEQITDIDNLSAWLERNLLSPIWSIQGDLDGIGKEDWIIEVVDQHYISKPVRFIAFLRNRDHITPLNLDSYNNSKSPGDSRRWQSFHPDPSASPVNVLQIGRDLLAFRVVQDGEDYKLVADVNSERIPDNVIDELAETQSWVIDGKRLIVQYDGREAVYVWDADQQKMLPTGFAPELQEENIGQAEKAIYFDYNPHRAVEILEGLLEGRIWENFPGSRGPDIINPPKIRPYALYLLGLAYEQAGDSDNAVRAYWQLWHEYPTNPYSIAAQSKLERR